jgi:hypothetical protein
MRVNISKSKIFAEQVEYLGYWITRQDIQPIRNKVETIPNTISHPNYVHQYFKSLRLY